MTDTTAPACTGFPDACGAPAGQPCAPGCPSRATDDYDAAAFDQDDDEDPHTAGPTADQERAWDHQFDGTSLGA